MCHPAGPFRSTPGHGYKGIGPAHLLFYTAFLFPFLLCPGRVSASGRYLTKQVRRGDRAESIARYFYGNKDAAPLVRAVAGMKPFSKKRLRPGTVLRLPIAWSYRIRTGDTWSRIGKDYLSAGFRGRLLAVINGKNPTKKPPPGHVIRIPAALWYKPRRVIHLQRFVRWLSPALSQAERKLLAERILAFNKLSGNLLRRNKTILVPLFSLHARHGLVANDLPVPDPRAVRRLGRTHRAAKALLEDGRYEEAAALCLKNIAWVGLAPRQGALIYKDLAHAFVAKGWRILAKTMASLALALDSKIPLNSMEDSPKILRLFGARGRAAVGTGR